MDSTRITDQLTPLVIREIQKHYLDKKVIKTEDCVNDMMRDHLFEADVEKVIMNATIIEKVMTATSPQASNPQNTHYVIYGESTRCKKVYCKICSNYHSKTGEFIQWRLTSFCISRK